MKVLHVVSTNQRRGAELFARDLIRQLGEHDIEQQVAVLYGPIEDNGVPFDAATFPLTATSPNGRSYHAEIARETWSLLGRLRPDVVQTHGSDALKYTIPASLIRRIPVVHRNIGLAAPWARKGPRRGLHAGLMRSAKHVLAVSEAVGLETVHTFGVRPQRMTVSPNAVDPARIRPRHPRDQIRRALGLAPEAKVLTSIAALTWEKDPIALLEVAERVLNQEPRSVLLIAGTGPLLAQLEAAITSRNLGRRCLMLGSRADVGDLLSASDVLLVASRTEGMPASIIEAGMLGVPSVAYSCGGIGELVSHRETGILVDPGAQEAMASGLLELLGNEALRKRLGETACAQYRSRFSISSHSVTFVDAYRQVVNQPSP